MKGKIFSILVFCSFVFAVSCVFHSYWISHEQKKEVQTGLLLKEFRQDSLVKEYSRVVVNYDRDMKKAMNKWGDDFRSAEQITDTMAAILELRDLEAQRWKDKLMAVRDSIQLYLLTRGTGVDSIVYDTVYDLKSKRPYMEVCKRTYVR